MPSLHRYCACGGEIIADSLSLTQLLAVRAEWNKNHSGPDCAKINRAQAIVLKLKRWL